MVSVVHLFSKDSLQVSAFHGKREGGFSQIKEECVSFLTILNMNIQPILLLFTEGASISDSVTLKGLRAVNVTSSPYQGWGRLLRSETDDPEVDQNKIPVRVWKPPHTFSLCWSVAKESATNQPAQEQ